MARKALTQAEIYDLYKAAQGGDTSALRQLNEVSSYYGKKGNERIVDFEKADMHSQALTRAQHFLDTQMGRDRFTRSKKLDAYEAYKNASEARRFLRAKTGTPTRERLRESKVFEKLEKGGHIPGGMTSSQKQSFSKFLRSSAWDEIKNTLGSQEMKDIAEKLTEGYDIDELLDAYKEYDLGNIDFVEFVDGWAEI